MCDSNLTTNLAGRLAEAVEEAARRDRAEAVPLGFTTPLALGFEKFERALRERNDYYKLDDNDYNHY